ncbi:hypothetical protein G7Z17_g10726 [Cylindrodendrum hubeiense]|uniref:Glycosyltransferase family 28 N-terminal domain-containing protein n=1 Tax=Cylindrodendrum hubeiense TaxID=595255 RepID=A0A9P5L4J8_9HYPO|nr:hypothetical protein G7Z17_g10726 [Cylindrodendrum hubeiense]
MTIVDEKQLQARQRSLQQQTSRENASEPLLTGGFQLPDLGAETSEPPPYGEHRDSVQFSQPGFEAGDGRVNININTKNRRLADLLAPTLQSQVSPESDLPVLPPAYIPPSLGGQPGQIPPPRLNVVIQIVGSRGDVQPFVALGKILKDTYGHRIRIATHPTFQKFVEENGLEFFSIGGDPAELMAFMVKYPGLMPGFDAITSGEVSKRRRGIEEILMGCWRSCIEAGNGLGPPPKPHAKGAPLDASLELQGDPFVADAIIANPPSFAHIHIAEKMGIPLHMMFTSPALIPKPNDWGRNIDIAGFFFLNLASAFTPDPQLEAFLRSGPPPVYIGFGSIVVDDPNAMTEMIFEAVKLSGVRALVSKGWGGLGADELGLPDGVFMLGNVPHDWLFEHVSCVVHHGGAGTTAAGIKAGKPTLVVPFFGDQQFWGSMIARSKAGPDPIPYKDLTAEKLAEAIRFCLQPETLNQATQLGQRIREEKGTDTGGQNFHDHLDTEKLRCTVAPSRAAAWRVRRTQVQLSPFAAAVLVDEGLLEYSNLKLYRSTEYNTEDQPTDPISACACSLVADLGGIGMAIADMPRDLFKSFKKVKESNTAQPQPELQTKPTESTEKLLPPSHESTMSIPSIQELDSSPVYPPSESSTGARTPTMPTSQSNISQPSLSDASSTFSNSLSPGPSTTQRPTSRSSKEQISQAFSDLEFTSSNRARLDAAVGTGRGVGRIVSTGVKSPMNFCLGLAKGFRNIPRLYNDETVRPVEKVTDLSTGIKVAGKELGYGFFDGVAGLVTQPWKGAEKEGAPGLVKGFGKGIGGLIAKPAAAYTMQGVHAEINKFFTRSVQNYIISSRAIQGQREMHTATPEERADVIKRWNNSKFDLKNHYVLKKKETTTGKLPANQDTTASGEGGLVAPKAGWLENKRMSLAERKRLEAQRDSWKKGYVDVKLPTDNDSISDAQTTTSEDTELELAIQASVQETSHGNAEEDAMIEAAIRESIRAVRERVQSTDTAGPLPTKDMTIFDDESYQVTDGEYQDLIEKAIQQSLGAEVALPQDSGFVELDSTEITPIPDPSQRPENDDEDDAELQRVIEESRNAPPAQPPNVDEEEELQRAIAASKEEMQQEKSQRTEEDIVLEYVKKQSLAEEEYWKQRTKAQGKVAEDNDDEDEELRRAMEESLRLSRGDDSGPSGS